MIPILAIAAIGGVAILATSGASNPLGDSWDNSTPIDYTDTGDDPLSNLYPVSPDNHAQITAFLAVIRAGESSNNYYAKVGGGNIGSLATYPTWAGVGNSHAVGAYQFEPETWNECAAGLNLTDFSMASQDAAAVFLIQRRGAYQAVLDGNIASACDLLKNEWQMFTQSQWNADAVADAFNNNGGVTA